MDHYEEIKLVEELGDKIGYGNMMCIASVLWSRKLSNWHGYDLSDGAFVPTLLDFIKDEYKAPTLKDLAIEQGWVDKYYKECNPHVKHKKYF